MHTAEIVLGREAHPRSIVCPLTSSEWQTLVNGYGIPEDMLQGTKVTPKFSYAKLSGTVPGEDTHQLAFLKYRTSGPFFRDVYTGAA
jgi:hypothetical protein